MGNHLLVRAWQRRILEACRAKLGRELTAAEERFVTARGAFVALEAIEDTVRAAGAEELERYLRSEP